MNKHGVFILNFDATVIDQSFYCGVDHQIIDLYHLPQTNCYCDEQAAKMIRRNLPAHLPGIYFIGSGNYHYATYFLLEKIDEPFTLILFDHHGDFLPPAFPEEWLLSCGGWMRNAIKLPNLAKVVIVGAADDQRHEIPVAARNHVAFFSRQQLKSSPQSFVHLVKEAVPTEKVYISIDKDVLETKAAMTNWDHGTMKRNELLQLLKNIAQEKRLIAMDVCGEYRREPGRLFSESSRRAVSLNNRMNEYLLQFYLNQKQSWTKAG